MDGLPGGFAARSKHHRVPGVLLITLFDSLQEPLVRKLTPGPAGLLTKLLRDGDLGVDLVENFFLLKPVYQCSAAVYVAAPAAVCGDARYAASAQAVAALAVLTKASAGACWAGAAA